MSWARDVPPQETKTFQQPRSLTKEPRIKRNLLLPALIAVTLTACGKKEEAAIPGSTPAPATAPAQGQAEPAAQLATRASGATAPAEEKQEEKK
jgi:hypothetical protein